MTLTLATIAAMSAPGIFIVFEGIDGAGKTTQVDWLVAALRASGEDVVQSKEPTDGPWGQKVRASATTGRLPLAEELEAFSQDRRQHVAEVIGPALNAGKIVVLDRYFYSTVAYQGARGGNPEVVLQQMLEFAPVPDVVFLIDVDPRVGVSRVSSGRGEIPNEFEKVELLTAVRKAFSLLESRSEVVKIDGHWPIDLVTARIVETLVRGVLRSKRCAKNYVCDELFCSFRISGECDWARIQEQLRSRRKIKATA